MTSTHKILYTFAHALTFCGLASWFWLLYTVTTSDQFPNTSLGVVLAISFVSFGAAYFIYTHVINQVVRNSGAR